MKESKSRDILNNKQDERKILAECLFYIYYQTVANPDDLSAILALLSECSAMAKSFKLESGAMSEDADSFYVWKNRS